MGAIPIGLFTSADNPFDPQFGETVTIFGDTDSEYNKAYGNFGLLDLSKQGMDNSELENWITNDYIPAPAVGERIPTQTGVRSGPVYKGFTNRISNGDNEVMVPVIDLDTLKKGDTDTIIVVGYAKFHSLRVYKEGRGTNEQVLIEGDFQKFTDPSAESSKKAQYFGGKKIYLVK